MTTGRFGETKPFLYDLSGKYMKKILFYNIVLIFFPFSIELDSELVRIVY